MKKSILVAVAFLVATAMCAEVVEVDLGKAGAVSTAGTATPVFADGVLTVNWEVTVAWEVSGVEMPLENLAGVTNVNFEYMGDGQNVVIYPYLRDTEGNRWFKSEYWPNAQNTDWTAETFVPDAASWDAPAYACGDRPFNKIGFVANPGSATSGVFKLRNVKIVVSGDQPLPTPQGNIYNAEELVLDQTFTRTQCGTASSSVLLPEISGITCSRVTPGYIWMESDDNSSAVVVGDEKGNKRYLTVILGGIPSRNDWEDMCGGVYNGTNYIFVGAIGDNNATKGNYYIHYFEEPSIPASGGGTITIPTNSISFRYPDGNNHNAEALMYDNIEQMLYVITKVYYDVCSVYSLPMSLEYGSATQTLTKVCDLGLKSDLGEDGSHGFHLVTAADVSPDGRSVIIKNHNNTDGLASLSMSLIWEREGNESLRETLKRQPKKIAAYEYEWQGEAVCWLDATTFYTTSDDNGNPPIYKYVRPQPVPTAMDNTGNMQPHTGEVVLQNGQLYILRNGQLYSLTGQQVNFSKIRW